MVSSNIRYVHHLGQPNQESLCLPNIMSLYIAAAISNAISDMAIVILPCALLLDFEVPRANRLLMLGIAITAVMYKTGRERRTTLTADCRTILASCGRIYAYFKIDYNNASNDYSCMSLFALVCIF